MTYYVAKLERAVGPIKVISCPRHCDGGYRGCDACNTCRLSGSGFRLKGTFYPNTEDGWRKAYESLPRYHIRIQRRCPYNGLYDYDDWRAYREYLVWPKTFTIRADAEAFMEKCFTFEGLPRDRKMSASVVRCGARQ